MLHLRRPSLADHDWVRACVCLDCWQGSHVSLVAVTLTLLRLLRYITTVSTKPQSHQKPFRLLIVHWLILQDYAEYATAPRGWVALATAAAGDPRVAAPDAQLVLSLVVVAVQQNSNLVPSLHSVAVHQAGPRLVGDGPAHELARVRAARGPKHASVHPAARQAERPEHRKEQDARHPPARLPRGCRGRLRHLGLLPVRGKWLAQDDATRHSATADI